MGACQSFLESDQGFVATSSTTLPFADSRSHKGPRPPRHGLGDIRRPCRAASPYLFSGLLRCETCGNALTAAEAKSGKYTYYVCQGEEMDGVAAEQRQRLETVEEELEG